MTHPSQRRARVVSNDALAHETFKIRIDEPDIAGRILPGQFVMIRAAHRLDPLLARPYALYDTHGASKQEVLDIVYLRVGNGTRSLSRLMPGDMVDVWGPLGNTFPIDESIAGAGGVLMVAGGIGQTPFLAVSKELLGKKQYGGRHVLFRPTSIRLAYGARSADHLAGLDDFQGASVEVQVATNDGSKGKKGYVTDLASEMIDRQRPSIIFGCGPQPMLERLTELAGRHAIPTFLSLETKMACGYGVCFSCVAGVKEEEGWDYRRVCLEGPVFPAERIQWA